MIRPKWKCVFFWVKRASLFRQRIDAGPINFYNICRRCRLSSLWVQSDEQVVAGKSPQWSSFQTQIWQAQFRQGAGRGEEEMVAMEDKEGEIEKEDWQKVQIDFEFVWKSGVNVRKLFFLLLIPRQK